MGLLDFFRRKPKAVEQVVFDDVEIRLNRLDEQVEKIKWNEIAEVTVVTTNEGPWLEDVFYLLIRDDGQAGCTIPQLAEGSQPVMERLMQLPGFDNAIFMDAMRCTENARFVCWKRT